MKAGFVGMSKGSFLGFRDRMGGFCGLVAEVIRVIWRLDGERGGGGEGGFFRKGECLGYGGGIWVLGGVGGGGGGGGRGGSLVNGDS